jgi:TonB family protein
VKGEVEKTQSFLRRLGFFIGIWDMTGNATLKIAASISLGIHLLFLAIASNLFQYPKSFRMDTHYVKIILHPLASDEKPHVKIVPPVPLRVGNQVRAERAIDSKELNEVPLSSHTTVAKTISLEGPEPISKNKEEEEISDAPTNIVTAPGTVLDEYSNLENEGNSVSSKETASNGGNGSVSLPAFRSGEFDGATFSYNSPGDGNGSGNGTGHAGGPGKGSGKGGGIFGKMFSSRGGGNGAWPRYTENPKPTYPEEAREKGHQGEVVLRVEVLINGQVGQIEIKKSSGYELLDHSALTTVKRWRFIPAKKGEASIPLWVNIPIKFQLQ